MTRPLIYLAVVSILGALFGLGAMGPAAFSKTACHDDGRTNAYWAFPPAFGDTYRPDDITAHFRRTHADPIPAAVYWVSGKVIDPRFMPTLFGLLASALTALFALLFGLRLLQREGVRPWLKHATAIAFAIACLAVLWQKGMPLCGVGNGGDFLVPLLLSTVWAVDRRSPWILGAILFVAAGTYPSAFLLCVGITGLAVFQRDGFRPFIQKEMVLALIVGLASALVFRAGLLVGNPDPLIGSLRSAEEMVMDPVFHLGGRHPIWMGNWFLTIFIGYQGGLAFRVSQFLMLACLLLLLLIRRTRFGPLHPCLRNLVLVSISLFILAWAFLPALFYPSRYVRGALPIFFIGALLTGLAHWIHDATRKKTVAVVAALLLVFMLSPSIGRYRYTQPRDPKLFQILSGLPPNTLIAGHPYYMDNVVYFGGRSVLTSDESLMPVFDEYHRLHSERLDDLFRALYADRPVTVLRFCRKYNVTHLLLHRGLFILDKERSHLPYVKPFGQDARAQALLHFDRWVLDRDHFPGEVYNSGYQVLVPCEQAALFGDAISESHP